MYIGKVDAKRLLYFNLGHLKLIIININFSVDIQGVVFRHGLLIIISLNL